MLYDVARTIRENRGPLQSYISIAVLNHVVHRTLLNVEGRKYNRLPMYVAATLASLYLVGKSYKNLEE